MDAMKLKDQCVEWIRNWFDENGSGCKAVIGISGGKDSTIVAALCVEALGRDRVFGVLMPNGKQPDIDDAASVVHHLGIDFAQIDIADACNAIANQICKPYTAYRANKDYSYTTQTICMTDQAMINLPPRIRMATLYAISQSICGRVANTCNLSEDWIGYSTRYGDGAGDFSPLGGLTCSEVVQIGLALGLPEEMVKKVPSDGLCGKTDEDSFGFSYAVLDHYIRTGECKDIAIKAKIDYLHKKNEFKLKPIPVFRIPIEFTLRRG